MGKHMLLMLICCLVPLGLIIAVSTFGLSLGGLSGLLPYALVLMCPLMMIFMMRGMGHDHGASDAHEHHTSTKQIEPSPSAPLTEVKVSAEQKSCH
ncbi:MAG: DUF2933 domain-containing protein [Chloroflexi bacterium]|nr:DUF2933 domain-containing protein [Chloroflexota bacterium]